jgi:hypothetical protein
VRGSTLASGLCKPTVVEQCTGLLSFERAREDLRVLIIQMVICCPI